MSTKRLFDGFKVVLILFLIFGIGYPLSIYGIGQLTMPYQANGEPFIFDNRTLGSMLIYINFDSVVFFSTNNSYYDPYISLSQAHAEAQHINRTAGVPLSFLNFIINKNVSPWSRLFMRPVVNVNKLNYDLLEYYSHNPRFRTYAIQALDLLHNYVILFFIF